MQTTRRITRLLLIVLATAMLGACHLCGSGYGWGHHCHVRVRHCR